MPGGITVFESEPMIKKIEKFGEFPDGRTADLFLLDGGEGVTAAITNYGGIISSLTAPDKAGKPGEIGLGFGTLQEYLDCHDFFGALIGRVANRIRGGEFSLDGQTYRLWTDAGGMHLHGGREGFHRKLWKADVDTGGLRLAYFSPDGEENYPGNLSVVVRYVLDGRDLRIEYEAATDRPTLVNLTCHEYFNLACCTRDVLGHELRMRADRYTPADRTLLPTGEIAPVAGTPFDFTQAKPIGRDIAAVPGGYDHNFVFSPGAGEADQWLAEVREPVSGRTLAMATTEPCVQLYSGNFLDGTYVGRGGIPFRKQYAFCLEAQKHPDAIHHPGFASTVLRPGETYRQTTVYRFGVE